MDYNTNLMSEISEKEMYDVEGGDAGATLVAVIIILALVAIIDVFNVKPPTEGPTRADRARGADF